MLMPFFPLSPPNRPSIASYHPTRWIIYFHKSTSLVPSARRTSDTDVLKARMYMLRTKASSVKKTKPAAARTLGDRAEKLQNAISAVKSKLAPEGSDSGSELGCGRVENSRRM